jgi:uncharacterized Zn finger protein
MIEDWYEKLRCPKCGKTGMASLVLPVGEKTPAVESVPDGFKVLKTRSGPDFHCETCGIVAE